MYITVLYHRFIEPSSQVQLRLNLWLVWKGIQNIYPSKLFSTAQMTRYTRSNRVKTTTHSSSARALTLWRLLKEKLNFLGVFDAADKIKLSFIHSVERSQIWSIRNYSPSKVKNYWSVVYSDYWPSTSHHFYLQL